MNPRNVIKVVGEVIEKVCIALLGLVVFFSVFFFAIMVGANILFYVTEAMNFSFTKEMISVLLFLSLIVIVIWGTREANKQKLSQQLQQHSPRKQK